MTSREMHDVASAHLSEAAFLGVVALFFAGSLAVTIFWCASMAAMGEVPMPGGRTISMAWTRMCDQSWIEAGLSFLGMWIVMMVAMMLPSLLPVLWRYRAAHCDRLTCMMGVAYFVVWALAGLAIFPVGVLLATAQMRAPALAEAAPIAAGVVVLLAGALQFTPWKARHLAHCRTGALPGRAAWRHGLCLGRHCVQACAGPMAVLLVVGVMDLRAMLAVAAAVTAERLAPAGEPVARGLGAVAVGAGFCLIAQAAGL